MAIQRNCLAGGSYMYGMLNGMILSHAIMTDASPKYEPTRKHSRKSNNIRYRKKNEKFK